MITAAVILSSVLYPDHQYKQYNYTSHISTIFSHSAIDEDMV